jgi:hypothetical protein
MNVMNNYGGKERYTAMGKDVYKNTTTYVE